MARDGERQLGEIGRGRLFQIGYRLFDCSALRGGARLGVECDVPAFINGSQNGGRVKVDDSLITAESNKATMEIPAPFAGVIKEIKLKIGDTVNTGALIALMEDRATPAISSSEEAFWADALTEFDGCTSLCFPLR